MDKKEYRKGYVIELLDGEVWKERDMRIVDGKFVLAPYDISIAGTTLTVNYENKTTTLKYPTTGKAKNPVIKSHQGHSELHWYDIALDTDVIVYLMPYGVFWNTVLKSGNAPHSVELETSGFTDELGYKAISMSGVGLSAARNVSNGVLTQSIDKATLRTEYISKLEKRDEDEKQMELEQEGKGGLEKSKDYEAIADNELYPIEIGVSLEVLRWLR